MPLSISLPTMPVEKLRISSPLEAGPSLLDAKMLPPQVTSALEYVSSRLVRKRLHLSLIVVRKDVQVPQSQLPPSPTRSISVTSSPAKSLFSTASSTITNTLRRASSRSSLSDCSGKSSPSSPSFSNSPSSPSSPSWSEPSTPNPYGISLIHACTLTPKAEKILRHYIHRAEKKFAIGSGWLSTESLATPITCSATNDLIRRSLAQNSIVFSSEGLTLLALDHLYTFKCHLHTYSRTLSPSDFSLAVDELHRLILAQQGRRITKGYLMRAYDWLGVSLAALVDVNEGYKTAYGGEQRWGGIEVLNEERKSPPPLKTDFSRVETKKMRMTSSPITPGGKSGGVSPGWSLRAVSVRHGDIKPSAAREVQVGESAQGVDRDVLLKGNGENLFEEAARLPEDRGPHRRGATTPNGFEDITPVTKGEWLCLMVGDGWKEAKTAPIITC